MLSDFYFQHSCVHYLFRKRDINLALKKSDENRYTVLIYISIFSMRSIIEKSDTNNNKIIL